MRLVLEVITGPLEGKQIEAKVGETVSVGRSAKASVVFADNFMSGAHFAVEGDAKGFRLRDLNSRNGTKLNGEMITEAAIKDGDQVHAGHTDFIVRVATAPHVVAVAQPAIPRPNPTASTAVDQKPTSRQTKSKEIKAPGVSGGRRAGEGTPAPKLKDKPRPVTSIDQALPIEKAPAAPIGREPQSPPAPVIPAVALASYEAATPDGRLLQILSNQPQALMALIDAIKDARVLELLRAAGEEYQSLYTSEQNAALAPYLVCLPPHSVLLKQMIEQGWGHEWGVYFTCSLSLSKLREYFRTFLMVTMPDGMELFSRFYDPGFFRSFLETCTAAEADKFFGPITSYFMEDERPEILLQFTKNKAGAEKKGHLLSMFS
jgi:hypothetical protein